MEITDLMVGDYVVTLDGILKKITRRDFEDNDFDRYFPIPLTPEILKRNKLKHRFSDSDFAEYEEWYSEDKRFRVIKDKIGYFARVEDENLMYTKTMGIANYVHELQHVVKHAKYEKEIML